MALYHKWDVKNDFAYVLQFFSLISDSLGSVVDIQLPKVDLRIGSMADSCVVKRQGVSHETYS